MVLSLALKSLFFEKFFYLFSKYDRIIMVKADNVGSQQLQKCRKALSKNSILILGKNTIIKKVLKKQVSKKPGLKNIFPYVSGNIGFIFTKMNPLEVKEILSSNKIPAHAKVGQIAQSDVKIPSGPTGIAPDGTPFFQALNIPTKISRGQIEIQEEVKIISSGKPVQNSEVALLQKLNIIPFSYELEIKLIFDKDEYYDPSVLEISGEKIKSLFKKKIRELSYISKKIGYPIWGSLEHSVKTNVASFFSIGIAAGFKDFKKKNPESSGKKEKKEETFPPKEEYLEEAKTLENSSETGNLCLDLFE
mmetsp:Transcript_25816/g.51779  ORF Transcript_25816/g.51779 Transcript_25816/m.51779 type:complete len:305 (+) Transcript_25816:1538-2452(+)